MITRSGHSGWQIMGRMLEAHGLESPVAAEIADGQMRAHADKWQRHPDYDPDWRPKL